MKELKFETWLHQKLRTLTRLEQRKKRLSKHEKQYVQGIQRRIASLFDDPSVSHAEAEKYQNIIREYGFTVGQAIGTMPIYYGDLIPQVRFIDEGEVAVVWLGKYKLKKSA